MIDAIPPALERRIIGAVPDEVYENQAVASVMSVMRSVGVPLGVTNPALPNLSSSLWRTVYDHRRMMMFFDSATTPNTFWVPLGELDFSEGAPVKKLEIAGGRIYAGNAAGEFVEAEPFTVLGAS